MKDFLRNTFSGKDNLTPDFIRILGFMTVATALGLQIYVVVIKSQPLDLQQFGLGMGAVFATLGAALKLKETTEPEVK